MLCYFHRKYQKLAIVLDADNPNLESKRARIRHILSKNTDDQSSPELSEKDGTIVKTKRWDIIRCLVYAG